MESAKNKIEIFETNGLYGCRDSITKEIVIEAQYDFKPIFHNGIAIVQIDNLYGVIDLFGRILVPTIYNCIYEFQGKYSKISLEDKWGIINNWGEEIISPQYDRIGLSDSIIFSEGIAIIQEYSLTKNKLIYGFANQYGQIIAPPQYSIAHNFKENLALVGLKNKIGYISKLGTIVIPIQYDDAEDFSEGLAAVKQNTKWGYIDQIGNIVIPFIYNTSRPSSEGLIAVKEGRKWGYINNSGEAVIPPIFDEAYDFHEGLAVVYKGHKCGYIDKQGQVVIPFSEDLKYDFHEGLARIRRNNKEGFIDRTGDVIIPISYDHVHDFSHGYTELYDP